ncbi:PriCT-2 domain-containing protein [Glaciimonas sp. PAMC28666]|uniref:PriCT-2 domain-containing protein n=1 Tax=Glaciimonas sp. PAMC28666 TaxID=2807626 RepID=UPI001962CDDA|nr:PriCT-2 domain-containing protein [Glaciimonas sp. PAMC28666]QRX83264.1 PriCT-2 domain-containing protein [Glaciimonas sp. PAMC28666]
MSLHKAAGALSFVPPHDRDLWVKMGMAVKAEFAEDGFDAWDAWSQGAESYSEKSARAVWRSIGTSGKIGIGTLFHEAAANGWRDNDQPRGPLTAQEEAEKQRARAMRDAATVEEDARKQRGYRAAAEASQNLIDLCQLETHYYLNAKGLPAAVGLVADHVLIVPMRNLETNQLQGMQSIEWLPEERQWEKKMAFGMRAKGSVLRLGNRSAAETFLCEGYATGLSIEMALHRLRLNASVLVCFSDSNMAHVGPMIQSPAFVVADNDVSGAGEKAAKKAGLPYCMSDVIGEDANDLHQRAGLMKLCKLIIDVRMRNK